MRRGTTWLLAGVALGAMFSVGACSSESEDPIVTVVPLSCAANTTQCADGANALVCPSDGSGWVSFPCAGGCADDVCTTATCAPGAAECVSDRLGQVCPGDGSGWLAVACNADEICTDGACGPDPNAPTLCTADESECASDYVVRTCAADGEDWFYEACSAGFVCEGGACVVDTENALCYPGEGFCSDATTAWVCNPSGMGFTEETCPTGTDCMGGMCVGANCTVGDQYCTNDMVMATCADGVEWTETLCAANEVCAEYTNGMGAVCVPMTCQPWAQACGNPDDASVSDTEYYSTCELSWDSATNAYTYDWVQYECAVPLECDPAMLNEYGYSPCNAECLPGAERCNGNSREICANDGTWGTPTACTSGGNEYLECIVKPGSMTADGLPDALCADPVCSFLLSTYPPNGPELGVCDNGQIFACDLNTGLLATTAANCAVGTCMSTGAIIAGQLAGMCVEQCQTGEEKCVASGVSGTYQTCANGVWSTTTQACTTGVCWDVMTGGLHDTFCGECINGDRRCEDEQVATCTNGTWGTAVDCTLGECQTYGQTAACMAECQPGETYCAGSPKEASDGSHWGWTAEMTCGTDGLFPTTTTVCSGSETCRISYTGVETGCLECLDGSEGGNDLGLADTRCASATTLQTCAGHVWPTATTCANGTHCEGLPPPSQCGTCFGDDRPCTQSNMLAEGFMEGCDFFTYNYGGDWHPTACGGVPDCCHDATVYDLFCIPGDPADPHASACVPD